jgi:hypothetical protein
MLALMALKLLGADCVADRGGGGGDREGEGEDDRVVLECVTDLSYSLRLQREENFFSHLECTQHALLQTLVSIYLSISLSLSLYIYIYVYVYIYIISYIYIHNIMSKYTHTHTSTHTHTHSLTFIIYMHT